MDVAGLINDIVDYGIFTLNPDGVVSSWNRGAERMKGYSAGEIIGRHFSCFYPDEDLAAQKPARELREAAEHGRFEDEGWRVRKDGSRFWANVIITAHFNAQGTLDGYLKISRDLTGRKSTEERFRLMVEASPSAMIMVDGQGRITLINAQTENLFGYDRGELIGQRVEVLVPMSARENHPKQRDKFHAAPTTRTMGEGRDLYGVTKNGTEVAIEIGLNPIETPEGRFTLATIINITERKKAERELRRLNESLEAQVSETRSAISNLQLAQKQLVQTEKMASLGGLVAGVAHEINTPIGVGVTAASHLADEVRQLVSSSNAGKLTKAQFQGHMTALEQSSDILVSNLRRAAELIQSFKRVSADQSTEERRRIHLKQYLEQVLISLTPRLRQSGVRVVITGPDDLEVDTVPGALSQVMTNLVMNSVIHAFPGRREGNIQVEIARMDSGVRIDVGDDGCGIRPEHMSRIFDPFFTTKRHEGGTGLGLHIVFNIVHQTLKGKISVDSPPGRGARFSITF